MIPVLFSGDATTFTGNGLGKLSDAISCDVVERLNGAYELEMIYPVDGIHYEDIVMNSLIYSTHDDTGNKQPFEVYKITKPINGKVTVYAHHISYRLEKMPVTPLTYQALSCSQALTNVLSTHQIESCPFDYWTDKTTQANFGISVPIPARTCLGGMEGSILDVYHGEYEWDGFTVKLHNHRGNVDTGITLKYGKNITDITQEEEISKTVTGVVPFWTNADKTQIKMKHDYHYTWDQAVYSQYADQYPYHFTIPLDLSDKWENEPTTTQLETEAQAYVNKTGLGIPRVSIEVSFVALWQTEEYKDIAPLERVSLGDTINVNFEKLGIETTARIIETDFNVLKDRYNKVQVGSSRPTFTSVVNDQNQEAITLINKEAGNINKATAWLTSGNGYIVARKGNDGEWKELFAMDTPDIDTATKVMRLNENGIGGSVNGIDGPYNAALLVDGTIVATQIKTGTLTDQAGKFSLDMTNGTLTMQDGTFSGTINGSVINWGGDTVGATMHWIEVAGIQMLEIKLSSTISGYIKTLKIDCDNVALSGDLTMSGQSVLASHFQKRIGTIFYDSVSDVLNTDVNLGTFESNGHKYLAVYHGTTAYGNVQLS